MSELLTNDVWRKKNKLRPRAIATNNVQTLFLVSQLISISYERSTVKGLIRNMYIKFFLFFNQLRNDLSFEHDNMCVYKNSIVKNLSNEKPVN